MTIFNQNNIINVENLMLATKRDEEIWQKFIRCFDRNKKLQVPPLIKHI